MSSSLTHACGTGGTLPDVGSTYAWLNPGNITGSGGGTAASAVSTVANLTLQDLEVRLVNASAVVSGNNNALGTAWPTSLTTFNYGGAADLWGLAITPAMVGDSDFGSVMMVKETTLNTYTGYLYASNFGWSISPTSTIDGVGVRWDKFSNSGGRSPHTTATVDYCTMTLYFTQRIYPSTRWMGCLLAGMAGLLASLRVGGIRGCTWDGAVLMIQRVQTRRARQMRAAQV